MFRWGVIGSGFAARKFVLGLAHAKDMQAVLVYSRTEGNARAFAADFRVPEVALSLDEAAGSASVDAFYIATPPSEHRPQALACLAAGKPVLIEKPLGATRADAEAIAAEAKARGVFCMEAMWTRFLPGAERARKLIAEGAVGEARSLAASFGASNTPSEADNQFRAELGGGALLHRGCYGLAFAIDLLGPAELAASAGRLGATGVDEDCAVVLRHESGALSTVRASLRAPLPNDLTVEGTHGLLRLSAPFFRPYRLELAKTAPVGRGARGNRLVERLRETGLAQHVQQRLAPLRRPSAIAARFAGNAYQYQAEEVARCVATGLAESALMPLDQSVRVAELIEEAQLSFRPPHEVAKGGA